MKSSHQQVFAVNGFTTFTDVYTAEEIRSILAEIVKGDRDNLTFRKTEDLFAIRQFLKEIPAASSLVFNDHVRSIITDLFGTDYFVVKSIYFDKPPTSNWFVTWHQDLTISVDCKADLPGYGPCTVKQNQYAVQPPQEILKDNFTIRIHLDDANESNGALKVISGSHIKGIYRPETIDWNKETALTCNVQAGGVMVMHPLLLHASSRTTNNKPRK